ncbi:MAG: PQQ-binding-like beta-propeller repeat protein [Alphaproteobacteria bacterium]
MTGQLRSLASTGVVLVTAFFLAGCESAGLSAPSMPSIPGVSSLFGEKEAPPLPGERVSVLSTSSTNSASSVEVKGPVILPAPRNNASWSQPGGVPSNSPGHLSFSGTGRKVWRERAGGLVTAFSAGSGSKLWRLSLQPEDEKAEGGFGGGLAIDNGRLYAATGFGTVTAINISSGKALWTKKLGVPVRASPTAVNGKVFVVNSESQLFALSGADGKELWRGRGLPEAASMLTNASPAVIGNTLVVAYSSGEIAAFDIKTGQQRWIDSVSGGLIGSSMSSVGDTARPVIDRNIVFASSQSGRIIATALKSGDRVWSRDIRSDQSLCVAGETVFAVDITGKLYALTRKTGKVRWVATLPDARIWNGPTLAGGKLWLVSNKGILVGVDARSGQISTKSDLEYATYIPPVVAGGRMFVLTDKARLIAIN